MDKEGVTFLNAVAACCLPAAAPPPPAFGGWKRPRSRAELSAHAPCIPEKLAPPQRACLSAGAKNTRWQMHHMPGRHHTLVKESPGPERKQVPFVSRWIVQRPPAGGGQAEVLVRYHIMPL